MLKHEVCIGYPVGHDELIGEAKEQLAEGWLMIGMSETATGVVGQIHYTTLWSRAIEIKYPCKRHAGDGSPECGKPGAFMVTTGAPWAICGDCRDEVAAEGSHLPLVPLPEEEG